MTYVTSVTYAIGTRQVSYEEAFRHVTERLREIYGGDNCVEVSETFDIGTETQEEGA